MAAEPHAFDMVCMMMRFGWQLLSQGQLLGEVDVRLVDDDDALELVDDLQYLVAVERVARRVVGRAYPYQLRVAVACCQQAVGVELVVVVKENLTILDVVDVGAHLIHAVCGFYGYDIVAPWLAEDAVGQVNGLVAAVAQEDVFGRHALDLGEHLLQLALQGVGITVIRCVIRVLVGIEKDVGFFA